MEEYSSILQKHNFVRTERGGTEECMLVPGLYFILTYIYDYGLVELTIAHDENGNPWMAGGHVPLSRDGFTKDELDPLRNQTAQKFCFYD